MEKGGSIFWQGGVDYGTSQIVVEKGVYSGREASILGGSHIVVEKGVYSGREG